MFQALKHHWREYLLEAGGLLVFMLGAGGLGTLFLHPGSPVSQAIPLDLLKHVGIGACMGLITFGIVSAIGEKSGAHINPAVTWAFHRQGKINGGDAIWYTIAQFAGAIVAPILLYAVIGAPFADEKVKYATSQPGPGGDLVAFAAEFVISFILMLVVLIALSSERLEKKVPAIIAVLIAVYIAFESPLSGMSMNPARSFGPALVGGLWAGHWLYWAAPVTAMLAAARLYDLLRHAAPPRVAAGGEPLGIQGRIS